jgi:hypothetical protein
MVRLPTTLTTIQSRRPRGQSSDTVVRRAEIPCRSTNRLSVHTRGSAEPSVRRRAPAAAGSDADPVVKVSLNEMLARQGPLKRGTRVDRALMRGGPRIARQRGVAKRQAGSVADVIIAWRAP